MKYEKCNNCGRHYLDNESCCCMLGFDSNEELLSELDKVRKQLSEAIEVIKFYSSQYNWVESGRNNEKMRITFDDNSILTKIASNGFEYDYEFKCGGRRARQFLKSLEEK